jgi:hypothetical protein
MTGPCRISVVCIVLLTAAGSALAVASFQPSVSDDRWAQKGVFFREHWAEFDNAISNSSGRMLRVNDAELSLHPEYGPRPGRMA